MNVIELPYNKFVGLEESSIPDFLLMLNKRDEYLNHLGTVHASALFALAEATSGFFLLGEFQGLNDIVPVVRSVETKYKKPTLAEVFSKANFVNINKETVLEELSSKGRILITVRVSLFTSNGTCVMQSDFQWFIAKKK